MNIVTVFDQSGIESKPVVTRGLHTNDDLFSTDRDELYLSKKIIVTCQIISKTERLDNYVTFIICHNSFVLTLSYVDPNVKHS